jgi:hypothetical protein
MDLFLVQHGEAKSETEDPEQSLTDRGDETVRGMPKPSGPSPGRSCWSGISPSWTAWPASS